MKKLFLPLSLLIPALLMSFALAGPEIKFTDMSHDFGTIPQGTPVTYEFEFTNSGDAELVLLSVDASCGCTTPEWPKAPIAPGETGIIKATFNAAADGPFSKSITVMTNVSSEKVVLRLKGMVEKTSKVTDDENGQELKLGGK